MATDRTLSYTSIAQSRTRWWSSVEGVAILIAIAACVIGMLILATDGLSKSTDWYEPTPMNLFGP